MKRLNLIGAGRVGRTLAALWSQAGTFAVGDVLTRSLDSARAAVAFVGAGDPAGSTRALRHAEVWLIATPDAEIARSAAAVAQTGRLRPGDIVFHCSGALAADVLREAAGDASVSVASVHPLKTFVDAAQARGSFAGTYCVVEGDPQALHVLQPAFAEIGAQLVAIDAQAKPLHHAAAALVCNDLTALMEAGLRCWAQAGMDRALAARMMESLVRETVDNVFARGTAAALTGPVLRGDADVVGKHLERLADVDARIARVYRDLSAIAVELARERGIADADALQRIAGLLSVPKP